VSLLNGEIQTALLLHSVEKTGGALDASNTFLNHSGKQYGTKNGQTYFSFYMKKIVFTVFYGNRTTIIKTKTTNVAKM
jgi:hypothetical protein